MSFNMSFNTLIRFYRLAESAVQKMVTLKLIRFTDYKSVRPYT